MAGTILLIDKTLGTVMTTPLTFSDACKRLQPFGLKAEHIYLIDLALLAEMAWADGSIQEAEEDLLIDYVDQHVKNINQMAGFQMLSAKDAFSFVQSLLSSPPSPALIKEIHHIIGGLCQHKNAESVNQQKTRILNACMDIGASAVTKYPYGLKERFTAEEKQCYRKIAALFHLDSPTSK
ncbi:MAG: hypothetical protein PF495_03615 [Spirochaetales bacterium]|jgi:hypothetical protein|nr:hypothetical protein [Spirochaetales bacterium]